MVAEYLPHVYDTAGELLDIFEKYANKSEAVLQDELEKYFEKLIDSNQLKTFIHMSNCAASIDNLKNRMPSVGNFLEKNKKFKAISDIVDFSKNALVNYKGYDGEVYMASNHAFYYDINGKMFSVTEMVPIQEIDDYELKSSNLSLESL